MIINPIASGSSGNCYLVSDGRTSLLLDAGISIKRIRRALRFGLSSIDACLITHEHGDHVLAAKDLLRCAVPVYASAGTTRAAGLSGSFLHVVADQQTVPIGTMLVTPFDAQHDAAEPLGFYITARDTREKLLYLTDSYYTKYSFPGVTHMIIECNYSEEKLRENVRDGILPADRVPRLAHSHMSLETLLDLLRSNDLSSLRQIWLCHLSNDNSSADDFRQQVRQATGAEVYIC